MISGGSRSAAIPVDPALPLVSIVIVTYNAAGHLQPCLDSIKAQSFKNIDLLILDGASKDNTVEIIKSNERLITYWQSEPDKGIYDAMNTAVKFAKGKWIL